MPGQVMSGTVPLAQNTTGEPSYYYPGTNIPDPKYAQKKAVWDQSQRAAQAASLADNRAQTDFYSNMENGTPAAMSYRTADGLNLEYGGSGGSGGGSRGSGGGGAAQPEQRGVALSELLADNGTAFGPEPAPVEGIDRAARTAANSAAFARAKDRIGLVNRGSLNALRGQMSERGIAGSGIEGAGAATIISGGNAQLGETVRDQAIHDLSRDESVEDRNYAGGIQQRGQNIQLRDQKRNSLQALFNMKSGTDRLRMY